MIICPQPHYANNSGLLQEHDANIGRKLGTLGRNSVEDMGNRCQLGLDPRPAQPLR